VAAGPVAVDIPGHSFSPADITVPVGTTVTWTNHDKDPHTATNDDGSAVTFDSGMLTTGKSFSFTFSTAGKFPYHCTFHSEMHGTVTVQ
jgi:plastocyanin